MYRWKEQETLQEKSNKPKTKRYNKIQIDTPRGERMDFGGIDTDELETDPDNAKCDEDELFSRYMKAAITTGVGDTFPNMMKRRCQIFIVREGAHGFARAGPVEKPKQYDDHNYGRDDGDSLGCFKSQAL